MSKNTTSNSEVERLKFEEEKRGDVGLSWMLDDRERPRNEKGNHPTASPVFAFMRILWHHACSESHSWQVLNDSMYQGLSLAIRSRMTFRLEDYRRVLQSFRPCYWIGKTGSEHLYTIAITSYNDSAVKSIEAYLGRTPLKFDGKRLVVGFRLYWEGLECAVTSFKDDEQSVVACHYESFTHYATNHSLFETTTGKGKILRRFTITEAQLKEREGRRRKVLKLYPHLGKENGERFDRFLRMLSRDDGSVMTPDEWKSMEAEKQSAQTTSTTEEAA